MFTNQSRLRYLLSPEHYYDPKHYELELRELFAPSWHFVGSASELASDGDFLTEDLFGTPIILRNFQGQIKAFKNICPHRHSMLTSDACGNSPKLMCQYHGWEFAEDGSTRKIPEARCFRPWDRENSHLTKVRLQQCGDLLFVALGEDAPPLEDWLDPYYEEVQHEFDPDVWRLRHSWDFDVDSNWKIPAENTLDSYHVATVHTKWFGEKLPSEQSTNHTLEHRFTSLDYDATVRNEFLQARAKKFLGGTPAYRYRHRHLHPNFVFCMTDMLCYAVTYQPTGPTTCRIKMRFYAYRGKQRDPVSWMLSECNWRISRRIALGILTEDADIYPDQQRGIAASNHPGVIGAREERIHYFQRSVLAQLGLPIPPDPATGDVSSLPTGGQPYTQPPLFA